MSIIDSWDESYLSRLADYPKQNYYIPYIKDKPIEKEPIVTALARNIYIDLILFC
jgi:hypothetical protein